MQKGSYVYRLRANVYNSTMYGLLVIYTYICIYMCLYIYIYTYIYIYIYKNIYIYIYIYIHTLYVYIYIHIFIYVYIWTDVGLGWNIMNIVFEVLKIYDPFNQKIWNLVTIIHPLNVYIYINIYLYIYIHIQNI